MLAGLPAGLVYSMRAVDRAPDRGTAHVARAAAVLALMLLATGIVLTSFRRP